MLRLEWVPKVVLDQRWKVRTKVQNLVWGHSPKKENKKKKQKSGWRLLGSNIHTVQHNQNEESSRSCEKICCSTEIMGVTRGKENNRLLMFVIVQLLLMKYLKMYYLLENEWRVLWHSFIHNLPLQVLLLILKEQNTATQQKRRTSACLPTSKEKKEAPNNSRRQVWLTRQFGSSVWQQRAWLETWIAMASYK